MSNLHSFIICIFLVFAASLSVSAQTSSIPISSFGATPAGFSKLLSSEEQIREDHVMNEELLDLVNVVLADSVVKRKTERHQFFSAAIIRPLGFRWERIRNTKQKFIGTAIRHLRVPGPKPRVTEFDVNWDLAAHLKKYIDITHEGYQRQIEINRKMKGKDITKAPFTYPDENADLNKYRMHCELTPPWDYLHMLNEMFYPCLRPKTTNEHPNFGEELPSIGLYGVFCSDCNHSCHPEIHPYEWLWWLNVNPNDKPVDNQLTWVVGLFKEASNRFPHWSPDSRTGMISIPFAFPTQPGNLTLSLEHLVFSEFDKEELGAFAAVPNEAVDLDFLEHRFHLQQEGYEHIDITLRANSKLSPGSVKIWYSDVNVDKEEGIVSGRFNLATSSEAVYTFRLTSKY